MSGAADRSGGNNRAGQESRTGVARAVRRGIKIGIGPVFLLACVVFPGLVASRRQAVHPRAGSPSVAPAQPLTPFEVSFGRAQRWYFRAQVSAKQQLEALEEWDGDALRGSAPDIYRRCLMARIPETGLAEAAALEAAGQAQTSEEVYRVTRLLVHIERDLGHHQAEVEQARKLVALRIHNTEALLLLRTAEGDARTEPARRVFQGGARGTE